MRRRGLRAHAIAASSHATRFAEALPTFAARWFKDFALVRAAIERALPLIVAHEDQLATRVTRDLAITWPTEPVVLAVTAHARAASRWSRSSFDAPTLDVFGGCFSGAALLECAFTRAVRAITPTAPRERVAHTVGEAVRAAVPGYQTEESRWPPRR